MRVFLGLFALAALLAALQIGPGQSLPKQQAPVGTDCALDGSAVNSITGEPVPRARITLVGPGGQAFLSTDVSGRWSFSSLACGPVRMMASRPGFINSAPASTMMLTSGTPLHNVAIRLTPTSVIAGKVLDDQGDPVMNAQMILLVSRVVNGRRSFMPTGSIGGNPGVNDLGEYRMAGLAAGKYIVCAHPNQRGGNDPVMLGESCYPGPIGDAGDTASMIDVNAGREMRVDFTLHEVTAVHVRGVVSGLPKTQGVGLSLVGRGFNNPFANQARITPDGRFDVTGVAPGAYTLSADYFESGARLFARVPVEVRNSDVEDVAVHLEPGFTVTGKVRVDSKSGGVLDRSFSITLRSSDPTVGGAPVKWSPDYSTFTIADMAPGNYRLEANPPAKFFVKSATMSGRDLLVDEIPLRQSAGPIEIVLSDDGGAIDAQVTDAADQPAPGASVMVFRTDGRMPRTGTVGRDGHVRLQGFAPGDYRIYAWDDSRQVEYANPAWMQRYAADGVSVSIQAGQTARVAIKQQTVPE